MPTIVEDVVEHAIIVIKVCETGINCHISCVEICDNSLQPWDPKTIKNWRDQLIVYDGSAQYTLKLLHLVPHVFNNIIEQPGKAVTHAVPAVIFAFKLFDGNQIQILDFFLYQSCLVVEWCFDFLIVWCFDLVQTNLTTIKHILQVTGSL